jgi:hypothetical protein
MLWRNRLCVLGEIELVRYTEEKVSKTLDSIKKLIDLDEQRRTKLIELQRSLIRIGRAIKPECWINDKSWRKMSVEERCVKFQSSGSLSQDIKEFPFYAHKQWLNDRKKLIKDKEIES